MVQFVLKTGKFAEGNMDGSVMVVDIGGNCGYCRSYISAGNKKSIMFGWEIEGCTNGTKSYAIEENSWYAFEQGRKRVISGRNQGKDYIYLKINGRVVSSFYGEPDSRPFLGEQIYVEATQNFQVVGYDELSANYYVDGEPYLSEIAQRGFTARKPKTDPTKEGSYFVGWYTAGGELFDFANTKLTNSINLYAHFTTETVTAKFKLNDSATPTEKTVGKGCLVPEEKASSYYEGQFEYVFKGWKKEGTGELFDFATDRIYEDTTFIAYFEEKDYYVSYYANGALVKNVPFKLSTATVAGKEPDVPAIPNTTGKWETHSTSGLTGNMTVNAVYTVSVPSASSAVTLSTYEGSKVYLNTDTIHNYLTTESKADQTAFVREFCSTRNDYQDHQNTTFRWSDSGNNSTYTVYFADNAQFKNSYIVTTAEKSLENEAGIFLPGKTYYWFVCGNDTGKCSAVDSFQVVNSPVRYITAGNVINMRDLGGQVNSDGNRVKYELVYRGAALDEYTSHVDDTARNVFHYLGMKSEIELRGGKEHPYTGWDGNNPNTHYIVGAMYQEIVNLNDSQKAQYKAAFEAMADESNYPFYFHCSAGADRTGTFAYLLYGLLGVSYDDIRPEYELTSFSAIGLRPGNDYYKGQSLDQTHAEMLEKYGDSTGNLQAAVRNFLTSYIGLSEATLDSIRTIMLDNGSGNDNPYKLTVDVLGKKYHYQAFDGIYFMPESPKVAGKIFKGFYDGTTKYNGYATGDMNLTAKFEDIQYEAYDIISLADLGITEDKILNQTNTLYSYDKLVQNGGRLFQFILEPIGTMNNGDGPQLSFTNDWSQNSAARVWFQSNTMSQVYYSGILNSPPDISKTISLEAGKQYEIEYAIRVMNNKGYEGQKVFEVTVNGELVVQYIGCTADLSDNKVYFHGGTGSAYLINKPVWNKHTVTVNVLGEKHSYRALNDIYYMPDAPQVAGKLFKGFYQNGTKYNGYASTDITLTAQFEDIQYEAYDTITLKDLGIQEDKIPNKTNTVYTYEKTAKSGGRLLQFILEPIGDMKKGDGPQLALTNDWAKNSSARVWFQSNTMSQVYYQGELNKPVPKELSLEAGKQYQVEFAVRVMKNQGYEGQKVFEVTVNGELLVQYIGCTADLSENLIYFHGGTGSAYLINKPVYKTVKFYNGGTLLGTYKVERSGLLPKVEEPSPKNGLPFAGWYTAESGGKLWDENADPVYNDMNLYAHFANVRVIKANVDGKTLIYRVGVGKTLDELPKPTKQGHVFMGWLSNGSLFTGKVSKDMEVTASFEAYSFDDYDEISLRDLGINRDLDFAVFGDRHTSGYTYHKEAKTGGRVFKAIYIPTENMMNGPQVSFSTKWDENYFAKLYFTKYDMLYVYSSGIDGGLPTLKLDTELLGGKEYEFEIGVRVLNNKGYKGIKVLTVYLNGELIFEEFNNKANLEDDVVFFQGLPNTGIFRNIDIYKTVSFYDGDKLLSSVKVLRGELVKSIGKLADKGDRLFMGWFTEFGREWNFDLEGVYLDTVLKAKFQKRTYPVLLMVDDILYKRLYVSAGECADIFDYPTKDGYEFDKWLMEDGKVYDMQTPVNGPVVLTASFKKMAAKPASEDQSVRSLQEQSEGSDELKYVLFSLIGLAVIAAETGVILYKKRSKQS